MYAILDIETTGGQFNEEGITEIAIYRFDGHEVTDQFISLVNPEIPIQPFVVKLTGINNAMLKSAPRFFEVAKRIIEITDGCVLVAHNASFDHRILRTEFRRLGYDFQIKTLCTVELAQKLIPEQPSYSLGKLVRALGIPIADRHRANGDAMATLKLFRMLLEKDLEKTIVMELIKTEIEKGIEPRLVDIIADVPSKAGIYYVHNEAGNIIFIAKSKNIKKHLNQHFTGTARISKKIQAEVFRVTHEETGSELIAALKEVEEIRIHKPIYNSLRKKALQWGIYPEADVNGYLKLSFRKAELRKKEPTLFVSEHEGRNVISRVAADYKLCQKFTGQFEGEGHCPSFEKEKCEGACGGNITPEDYNAHVSAILERTNIDARNLMLIDRGRTLNERSAILIEDGICKGYAFFNLNYQLNNIDILRNILVPMPNQRDTSALIRAHLVKNKRIKIVSF